MALIFIIMFFAFVGIGMFSSLHHEVNRQAEQDKTAIKWKRPRRIGW